MYAVSRKSNSNERAIHPHPLHNNFHHLQPETPSPSLFVHYFPLPLVLSHSLHQTFITISPPKLTVTTTMTLYFLEICIWGLGFKVAYGDSVEMIMTVDNIYIKKRKKKGSNKKLEINRRNEKNKNKSGVRVGRLPSFLMFPLSSFLPYRLFSLFSQPDLFAPFCLFIYLYYLTCPSGLSIPSINSLGYCI